MGTNRFLWAFHTFSFMLRHHFVCGMMHWTVFVCQNYFAIAVNRGQRDKGDKKEKKRLKVIVFINIFFK